MLTDATLKTPLQFFEQFFTPEVNNLIYTEMVKFAEQQIASSEEYLDEHHHARGNEWKRNPMERNEVNPLLAIIITMGVIGYPTLR